MWDFLKNPEGSIGGGTGLLLGFAGSKACDSSMATVVAWSSVGLVGGSRIGAGFYIVKREMMQWQQEREYARLLLELLHAHSRQPEDDPSREKGRLRG